MSWTGHLQNRVYPAERSLVVERARDANGTGRRIRELKADRLQWGSAALGIIMVLVVLVFAVEEEERVVGFFNLPFHGKEMDSNEVAGDGRWSFGAFLNTFTGLLHVFAEAVGGMAADADNGQKRGEE